ncbi:MAG: flagellar basal-body rod protein FlgF [Bacillota bacterium]
MIRGLYSSATGMLANEVKMDSVSNNLANVDTTAFKRDRIIKETFPEMLLHKMEKGRRPVEVGSLNNGVAIDEKFTDFTQGGLRETSSQYDLAIEGDGFFAVDTPDGVKYTRDGNFTVDQDGLIVNNSGYPLLGENGVLQTVPGEDISVDSDGVVYVNDLEVDTVQVVDFEDYTELNKVQENLYETDQEVQATDDYRLAQGYLEGSNIQIVNEMVSMIEATRHYETNQKAIQAADTTLEKAVNQVGKLG